MAEFSADRSPQERGPGRFSPDAANIGAQAARPKRMRGQGQGLGRSAPPKQEQRPEIGRSAPPQNDEQERDLSYLSPAMQHFNMKGLGRDIPYIVWANLTGNYRLYAQSGRPPFDYLEDV